MARNTHSGGAPSQRQRRVAELLRRALSDAFARGDLHDPELAGTSITVGEVRTSPDLKHATVFVLPLGGRDVGFVLEALNRNRGELRRHVNRAVTLKYSPELKFVEDRSFDQMDHTRRLLSDPKVQRDLSAHDADAQHDPEE